MQSLVKFTFLIGLLLGTITTIMAQNEAIIVVNGGIFGVTNANTTIEDLNSGTAINMGTIGTTSIQDIVVDGQYAYVAAQDSIVKYDWTTKTKVAANAFGGASTVKLAVHGGHLLVGNWYEPWGWTGAYNHHFHIFNTSDLSLVDSIPQVTKPADDFVVIGDYAYIAQNNDKTVGWGDTLGYLAVVDLTNFSLVRYDTLSTTGEEIGRLVAEGDMVYAINGSSNTISSYNTQTLAKSTQAAAGGMDLKPAAYGPTAFTKGAGVWYFPYDSGVGSYNLSTNAIVTANLVNISGSFAFVMDTFNNNFCVSHINYSDQTQNKGRIYDMNGDSVGMFQVGFSPEALAIVSHTISGTVQLAGKDELNYSIMPNPVQTILTVNLEAAEEVSLLVINQVGQQVLAQTSTASTTTLDVAHLPAGVYFLAVVNKEGVMRTQQFVKQ
ncbi:T9SS type A sorting domain-containing protein [Aureispira anguillae]|uniref:T9SS type A sorting domain-containing protein n=1 Tax=Aureispira anguillae TaxID=2864201 RepID=A0A915YGL0_9BACT|nr:T9SS type A sorting domain-containing protein [Aureispira anguillae]BDS12588.1 T9SS type A sorting domain-containing protein [Aureispira anguillae]